MQILKSTAKTVSLLSRTYGYILRSYDSQNLESLIQEWAQDLTQQIGVELEITGTPTHDPSVLFVGNHISYLDIPLLMQTVSGLSFVAKSEVAKWPIFGHGAKVANTIFVERENKNDRAAARTTLAKALKQGKRIAVFPSGTTCVNESKDWRRGGFEVAHENNALVQPFRITYSPLRAVAYIDDDFLPTHLVSLMGRKTIKAHIEFHPPVRVTDPEQSRLQWQTWAREFMTNSPLSDTPIS